MCKTVVNKMVRGSQQNKILKVIKSWRQILSLVSSNWRWKLVEIGKHFNLCVKLNTLVS